MSVYKNIIQKTDFQVPGDWLQIKTIDLHTGGEPLRVILGGYPELAGNNVLEYRRYARENFDNLRKALMFEPRGHADMYGCLLVPPNDDTADFGILFLHNEGYSTMCGHAVIAISKLAVELAWIEVVEGENILSIDAPCGRIESKVTLNNGLIKDISFQCVPSFVVALDRQVHVEGYGTVNYDIAYGGAFYAYVDAGQLGLELTPKNYNQIIETGMAIKQAVMAQDRDILHPFEGDLSFLYGTIFIDNSKKNILRSKNVCVFADGEVDRSPTGSGVAGRMAIHHARNEVETGQLISVESITGSIFTGKVVSEIDFGPFRAVVPEVGGMAHITGMHTFLIDPHDPFKEGFFLR